MSLKALAEQRLAALDDQRSGAWRWSPRPVPLLSAEWPRLEQRQRRSSNISRTHQVNASLGLLAPDEAATLLEDLRAGRLLAEVGLGPDGDEILVAADEAAIDPGERRVVYRAPELVAALLLPEDVVYELHRMKCRFGGSLEPN